MPAQATPVVAAKSVRSRLRRPPPLSRGAVPPPRRAAAVHTRTRRPSPSRWPDAGRRAAARAGAAAGDQPAAPPPDGVAGIRARWAEVVASASPAIRPLLSECRPVALDGARLTLAFPEERGFMR